MALGDEPKNVEFGKHQDVEENRTDIQEVLSFLKTLIIFLCIAFFLRAAIVEAFKIPSSSMVPTLRIDDHILVSKFAYGFRIPLKSEMLYQYRNPERGDVVVFTLPDDPNTPDDETYTNIIKRVIGLPGDMIQVAGTKLLINNQEYREEYARWEQNGIPEGNFGPKVVPEGHVLLLGDNRDHSRDSRFWDDPFLDMKRIKGKAFIIYWSWDNLRRIGNIIR